MPRMNNNLQVTDMFHGVVGLVALIVLGTLALYWLLMPWMIIRRLDKLLKLAEARNDELESIARNTRPATTKPSTNRA